MEGIKLRKDIVFKGDSERRREGVKMFSVESNVPEGLDLVSFLTCFNLVIMGHRGRSY